MSIYSSILDKKKRGEKQFSILIDPDKQNQEELIKIVNKGEKANIDFFFVGGSLLTQDKLNDSITIIKENTKKPVIIFPGSTLQMSEKADGILFLSLISGRNPEMLIGNQVITAPILKQLSLEVLSTGYMLIDSGKETTVSYMSNTKPIPYEKNDIAACTAMAGEMLGFDIIFMDGGSGAINTISESMISTVRNSIDLPIIVGGGIKNGMQASAKCKAGADIIVVGNAIEKNQDIISEIANAIHNC